MRDDSATNPSWRRWLQRSLVALAVSLFAVLVVISLARIQSIVQLSVDVGRLQAKTERLESEHERMVSMTNARLDALERTVFGEIVTRSDAKEVVDAQAVLQRRLREQEARLSALERWRLFGGRN
jgi:outer membrane murein-binding lipoprotein Lpp